MRVAWCTVPIPFSLQYNDVCMALGQYVILVFRYTLTSDNNGSMRDWQAGESVPSKKQDDKYLENVVILRCLSFVSKCLSSP
jgi:hypothetical protein